MAIFNSYVKLPEGVCVYIYNMICVWINKWSGLQESLYYDLKQLHHV